MHKKYRLKKDVLGIKAGAIFRGNQYGEYYYQETRNMSTPVIKLLEHNMLDTEYFEKVIEYYPVGTVVKKEKITTYDGVDIYEGDEYYYVTKGFALFSVNRIMLNRGDVVLFHSKENALEYIRLHTHFISLEDIITNYHSVLSREDIMKSTLYIKLEAKARKKYQL